MRNWQNEKQTSPKTEKLYGSDAGVGVGMLRGGGDSKILIFQDVA